MAQAADEHAMAQAADEHATPPAKPPHTIFIPLPNVTGALHMGHALNNTLQDIITRWRRQQGYEALWMPGTDHAGIATQAVVERRLLEEEGLTRHDLGREKLVQRIWKWKDQYEQRILGQLRRLGASCDWRRTRFTLDEQCTRAVRRAFFRMFKDGLIYRGKRLVNWDTHLQTAVADDEIFHETVHGFFWTFTYPIVGSDERIAFSTTRPETMLGDTAVALHPDDPRYKHLIGKRAVIPLLGREIPIIADAELVDPRLGTGTVKVTPAHDPNDYACGLRHNLPMINILNPDGTLNAAAGPYAGMDRYAARDKCVEHMKRLGHFVAAEPREIEIGHSDRSKTPIEPYLSDQWFVRMDELAERAMQAVRDARVQFLPERYANMYLDWLAEKRDWCISRQLWWGHRIPVWRRLESRESRVAAVERRKAKVESLAAFGAVVDEDDVQFPPEYQDALSARFVQEDDERRLLVCVNDGHPEIERRLEGAGFEQDPDVLDTWFSSGLWPLSTLNWPDLEHNPPLDGKPDPSGQGKNRALDYFYFEANRRGTQGKSVLITSRGIVTLWVARMVVMGLYNVHEVPFKHVHVHATILDGFGQTMSKSKGNGVDPLDLIDKYGCDAVRFTIASAAGLAQDIRLPVVYECPYCRNSIPQTLQNLHARPKAGKNPRIKCPKCQRDFQFTHPMYDPEPGEPVARTVSDRFEFGRNFANKLWNAARFALMNLEGYEPAPVRDEALEITDRWILSRLCTTTQTVTAQLEGYQFDAASRALYGFVWNEFCDWYVEMVKPRLRDDLARPLAQRVLAAVLDAIVRLLQPFTPFVCEQIWQALREVAPQRGLPMPIEAEHAAIIATWPEYEGRVLSGPYRSKRWPGLPGRWKSNTLDAQFQRLQSLVLEVRRVRSTFNIPPGAGIELHVRAAEDFAQGLRDQQTQLAHLVRVQRLLAGPDVTRPPGSVSFALPDLEGHIPLAGLIDRKAELARQQKKLRELAGVIAGREKKLANPNFVARAPAEVVEQERAGLEDLRQQINNVEQIVAQLNEE